MMKLRTFILFTGGILAGGVLLFLLQYIFTGQPDKTRYVSMSMVFEECTISHKYQQELKTIETQSNELLAGMENEIHALKTQGAEAQIIQSMEQALLTKRDELSESYQNKTAEFEAVIWNKINKKVSEFGKEKGYDYIFGAKGDGSLMYASDEKDITRELIEYVNK